MRADPEVFQPVISVVPVDMVYLHTFRDGTDKCFIDDFRYPVMLILPVLGQTHPFIAIGGIVRS